MTERPTTNYSDAERELRRVEESDAAAWAHLPRLPDSIKPLSEVICACCTVETTWGVILAELERCERREYQENDGLAAVFCDMHGLTEHGTAIRGSWLTEKGVEALAFLRQWGADWRNKAHFVDSEGVHHGDLSQ